MKQLKKKLLQVLIAGISAFVLSLGNPIFVQSMPSNIVHAKSTHTMKYKVRHKTKTHVRHKHKRRKRKVKITNFQSTIMSRDTPTVMNFTDDLCKEYDLLGRRWPDKRITYDDSQMNVKYRKLTKEVIKQINELYIVTLIPVNPHSSNTKPDILIDTGRIDKHTVPSISPISIGNTSSLVLNPIKTYKNLQILTDVHIIIDTRKLTNKRCFNHAFQRVMLHELGHALGLEHTPTPNPHRIMSPYVDVNNNAVAIPDQHYADSLAILYKN